MVCAIESITVLFLNLTKRFHIVTGYLTLRSGHCALFVTVDSSSCLYSGLLKLDKGLCLLPRQIFFISN